MTESHEFLIPHIDTVKGERDLAFCTVVEESNKLGLRGMKVMRIHRRTRDDLNGELYTLQVEPHPLPEPIRKDIRRMVEQRHGKIPVPKVSKGDQYDRS